MEQLINWLPGLTALVLIIGAYWQLRNKAENNSERLMEVKAECYDKINSEKERSDERDIKHDKEIVDLYDKMEKKASKDALMEIKADIQRQYSELRSEIKSLNDNLMKIITKDK